MEREIRKQYKQANKEITEKWNNYMERAGKRLESRQNALSVALRSGDKESIDKAKKSLEDAQRAVTFHDTKYKAMVEDTALRISKANQTALDYVNGKTPNIYANNFNQINGDAKKVGIKFTTINEDVVRKRIAEGDIKLPKPRVSVPKDVRWNTKKMNSAVLQGILQGESMNDIAKRLLPIVDSNASSAIRNARTLVTQAENSGRLDSYKALEEEGAVLKKVWMATPDDRTRESHLELDGQEQNIEDPFVDMDGNELMFPADPSADPSTVYNCRCTMVTKIISVNGNAQEETEEDITEGNQQNKSEEQIIDDLQNDMETYIAGGFQIDDVFDKDELNYMAENSQKYNQPLYRVEKTEYTADLLDSDIKDVDEFSFDGTFRSFTRGEDVVDRMLTEGIAFNPEDAVIFETVGSTYQYDVNEFAQEFIRLTGFDQKESFVGGTFRLVDEDVREVNGYFVRVLKIEQIRKPKVK